MLSKKRTTIDRYSVHFHLGGIVLILIGLIARFAINIDIDGIFFWAGFVSYFLIPTIIMQNWKRPNDLG
jgi:hypothetical protein